VAVYLALRKKGAEGNERDIPRRDRGLTTLIVGTRLIYMGIAPKPLTQRNKRIVELKKKMTFEELSRAFDLSEARVKEIYYREIAKIKG